MSDVLERVLKALEIMGRRYVREFLLAEGWDLSQLRSDWYYAFKFILSKLYFQGRNDSLSDYYLQNMKECLDGYFLPNHTYKLEALWENHHIPHRADWRRFRISESPLWQEFNEKMGKGRDREMVLDVLRYLCSIPDRNIINRSIKEIEAGQIRNHRRELRLIWGVGPKTSAFYLRDVIFLFNYELSPQDAIELQPIDTWVRQVINSLRGYPGDDERLTIEEWLVRYGGALCNPALLNAGSWYLGKHSFEIVLKILAIGTVSLEALEHMELSVID
jgi:hypothetical protein